MIRPLLVCLIFIVLFLPDIVLGKEGSGIVSLSKNQTEDQYYKTVTNSLGMSFVWIEPGSFLMGSPDSELGRWGAVKQLTGIVGELQHQVTFSKGFYIQTTEVTQGQWKALMGDNPSFFNDCGDDCPVESVSWNDAQAFIQKLNTKEGTHLYRLSTEAEWEFACRAGTQTPFAFGKCLSTGQANYNGNFPLPGCKKGQYREKTVPVGSFSPNAWGLYDMHGNVWEWCSDLHGSYTKDAVIDYKGPDKGNSRVFRGGSWNRPARHCRSAARNSYGMDTRFSYIGFRLCRSSE